MKSTMELIDGKFYKDGVVVPLQFGNNEQIKLLRDREELVEAMKDDGVILFEMNWEVDIDGKYTRVNAPCVCGRFFPIDFPDPDKIIGTKASCSCGKKYVVFESEWIDLPCMRFCRSK